MNQEWNDLCKQLQNIPKSISTFMICIQTLYESFSGNLNCDQQIKAHINGSLFDLEILHPRSTILDNLKYKRVLIFGLNWNVIPKYDFDISKYQRVIDITTKGFTKCLTELEIFPYLNIIFNPINVMFNFENEWDITCQKENEILYNIYEADLIGLSVLRYYPIFYNAIQKFCGKPKFTQYLSILGSS
ncbi:hypothetical protein TRFO_33703 [Tritrichomonas foetus]|uniref:Uncharacterized protein n=1 Tax=Tritrichomonas foetus TaxID=1144522 RepID=A0A1J4JMX4_9EUKA|nr:hypothetical protein TRFO_33703 [Tritrichomonas foetus]|eukprot:OHS99783.1 hypothetical protein TRFO_33703 [Tritrichomonas foetus]